VEKHKPERDSLDPLTADLPDPCDRRRAPTYICANLCLNVGSRDRTTTSLPEAKRGSS